jgi:hypothetical protein
MGCIFYDRQGDEELCLLLLVSGDAVKPNSGFVALHCHGMCAR